MMLSSAECERWLHAIELGESLAPQVRFSALAGATTNRLYRVHALARDWVLRVHNPLLHSRRSNEQACWRACAAVGIAPPLHYWSADQRFCVSEWVGQAVERVYVTPLMQLLIRCHMQQQGAPATAVDEQIQQYLRAASPPELAPFLRQLPWQNAQFQATALPLGLAHRDVHMGNLRQQWPAITDALSANINLVAATSHAPHYWLLDFEYAALANPLWDLAQAQRLLPSRLEQHQLVQGYYQQRGVRFTATEQCAFRAAHFLVDLTSAAWACSMMAQKSGDARLIEAWYQSSLQRLQGYR
ncbi:MAG: phosphotransferase [Ferrimonas sp.]